MKTIVLNSQSLLDIAIQHCGGAEAAFDIALLNELVLSDNLEVGRQLIVPAKANRTIAEYYENRRLKPATGLTDLQFAEILDEGIDFMGIEIDFIVS